MDCPTYRRIKLATPHDASTEVIAHARECANCAAFTRQLETFEKDLHEVVNVPVPEGLAEQIMLRHRGPQWFKSSYLVLSASVMLSLAVLIGYNITSSRNELANTFVAHVVSEPEALTATGGIEPVRLTQAFADFDGELNEPIGEVRFLGQCLIDGVVATHILVRTPHGDATLILMPDRRADIGSPLTREGHAVIVVPTRKGSLGIVTDTPDQARNVHSFINTRVRFRS